MSIATANGIQSIIKGRTIQIAISHSGRIPIILRIEIHGIAIAIRTITPDEIGIFDIEKPGFLKYRVWAYDNESDSWKFQRQGELEVGRGNNLFRWNDTAIIPA